MSRLEDLQKSLNYGIPCYDTIDLSTYKSLYWTGNGNDRNDALKKLRQEADDRVEKVIGVKKSPYYSNLFSKISISASRINSSTIVNVDEIQKIINLNSDLSPLNRTMSVHEINSKIDNALFDLNKQRIWALNNSYTHEYIEYLKNNYSNLYYTRNGRNIELELLPDVLNYFDNIKRCDNDIKKIETQDLVEEYAKYIDKNKYSLYVAYIYLNYVQIAINNLDFLLASKYLFYINDFLNTKANKNLYFSTNFNYNDLYLKKSKLIAQYEAQVKDYRFKRRKFLNKSDLDNQNIINSLLTMDNCVIDEILLNKDIPNLPSNNGGSIHRERHEVTEEEIEMINDIIEDRMLTFLSLNPIAKFNGIENFSDYICYLYANGIILSEKIFNINTLGEANAAIYMFDAEHFEDDVKLTKSEAKKVISARGCKPSRNHTDNWKQYIQKDATKTTTQALENAAKTLDLNYKNR